MADPSPNGPSHRVPPDPFGAFRFVVRLSEGAAGEAGGFSDVTGLAAETEVETLREGGVNFGEQQLAGPTKFPSRLVLKRGLGDKAQLWNWYLQVMNGAIARKNVTIDVKSEDGLSKLSWTFQDACPVKWTGPELHATTSAVAFESIELVHRGMRLTGA